MLRSLLLAIVFSMMMVGMASANYVYYVDGYSRSDGTYVSGHFKTSPDEYKWNNLSY